MNSLSISLIVFACIFGSTLLGMVIRFLLPRHHLSDESKDAVKLGTGMIATLAALVLGLLIASAKGTFDTMTNELRQTGAKIVLLDHVMAQYGPETRDTRKLLRQGLNSVIRQIWPEKTNTVTVTTTPKHGNELETIQKELLQLHPQNEAQRWLQSQALKISAGIAESRWLIYGQVGQSSLQGPFLFMLICWLSIIFASFGLFSPHNGTVIIVMFICAISVAAALFLIMELDQPYQGVIRISSTPLKNTFAIIGK